MVIRIGGIVRPEPAPEQELSRIARDLGEAEFAEWARDYDAGRWVLVCLEMFADVVSSQGVVRVGDGGVHSLYFGVPHGDDNLAHASEAVGEYLDELAAALNRKGLDVTPKDLGTVPIVIELDSKVEATLSGR